MKYYLGTDIIEVERVKNAILKTTSFKEKIFTPNEIMCGDKRSELTRYEYYAGRFAAKEAVYKAVSCVDNNVSLNEIEILNDTTNKNRPYVLFLNKTLKDMLDNNLINVDVTISHIKEYATANAICYTQNQ